jgi:hypothetical protein
MSAALEIQFTNAEKTWDLWEGLTFDMLALVLPMLSPSQRRMLEHGMAMSMVMRDPDTEQPMSNVEALDREQAYRFVIEEVNKFRAGNGELDTHHLAGATGATETTAAATLF